MPLALSSYAGTPVLVLVIIMLPAPVNHERAPPLLIVIMLLAPVKLDHSSVSYRVNRNCNACFYPSASVLQIKLLVSLPSIVGLGTAINCVMPCPQLSTLALPVYSPPAFLLLSLPLAYLCMPPRTVPRALACAYIRPLLLLVPYAGYVPCFLRCRKDERA